jgi:hypothetical protein
MNEKNVGPTWTAGNFKLRLCQAKYCQEVPDKNVTHCRKHARARRSEMKPGRRLRRRYASAKPAASLRAWAREVAARGDTDAIAWLAAKGIDAGGE